MPNARDQPGDDSGHPQEHEEQTEQDHEHIPGSTAAADARAGLAAAGCDQVEVICGDGADGHPDRTPYDRITVTANAPSSSHE
ncbi:hypothetical protein GCM10010411_87920 [Actinomadura fulvescens]|uniref:PASTA domain-containing protein n=1 Tax=Actinomadura fulvescens TaxID=46160 RepID=A0ABN3QUG7_9ACTN